MQNYLELLDCVWRHCSSCRNVETPLYSKIDWRISPWIFSLLFFGNNSVQRIIVLVWMYAGNCCGFDHMFSLLKRCKYSLYSDTMLHFGSTNPCRIHAMNWSGVSNETNEVCTMYIEEFILVDIWIHCCTKSSWILNMHWKNAGLYTIATKEWEMWELLLGVNWQVRINRITIAWETVTYEN